MKPIKCATWNLLLTTTDKQNRKYVRKLKKKKVKLIFCQEAQLRTAGLGKRKFHTLFSEFGYKIVWEGEYLIAWDPKRLDITDPRVMVFKEQWFSHTGVPRHTRILIATAYDRLNKISFEVQDYHLPAGKDRVRPPARRINADKEVAWWWRQTVKSPTLAAGDDNVVENGPFSKRWWYMRRPYTNLRIIRARRGTHGKRAIDDFRVFGFKSRGKGKVMKAAGDHKIHIRRLAPVARFFTAKRLKKKGRVAKWLRTKLT